MDVQCWCPRRSGGDKVIDLCASYSRICTLDLLALTCAYTIGKQIWVAALIYSLVENADAQGG